MLAGLPNQAGSGSEVNSLADGMCFRLIMSDVCKCVDVSMQSQLGQKEEVVVVVDRISSLLCRLPLFPHATKC